MFARLRAWLRGPELWSDGLDPKNEAQAVAAEEAVLEPSVPEPPDPPLVAAMKQKPDLHGCVQVTPPTVREHAAGFTAEAHKLTSGEMAEFCRRTPLFRDSLDPPVDLSFADRAAYTAVLRAMKDEDKAALYASGGIPLIRETVLLAMKKLNQASKT